MTFFEPENLRAASGGRWLRPPGRQPIPNGVGIDTREDLTGKVFVAIKGDRFDGHQFAPAAAQAGALMLVLEQEIPLSDFPAAVGVLLVNDTRKTLARLALAYRRALKGTKVIAVVGSAGKTTTKQLIDAALAPAMQGRASPKSFNNDIGVPLTILNAQSSDKYLIVEVGTNALGEVNQLASIVEPDVAVITTIGREHLEGLGSLENIAQENAAVLAHLRDGGVAIANADASLLRPHLKATSTIILFGEAHDAELRLTGRGMSNDGGAQGGWWFQVNGRTRYGLALPGRHNAVNALAAVAVAKLLNVGDEIISRGLASAKGAPMRSAIHKIGSITVFNDAYNANPESMIAALDTFAETTADAKRRVIMIGDMLELGEAGPQLHREIGRHVLAIDGKCRIDHAVFVGELAAIAAEELVGQWRSDRVTLVPKLQDRSLARVARLVRAGDAILIKGSRGMEMERIVKAMENGLIKPARALASGSRAK
jgi:UDP-N-acetylmuramoyl-tripeptide--D-alanyl-D-alanine ligase